MPIATSATRVASGIPAGGRDLFCCTTYGIPYDMRTRRARQSGTAPRLAASIGQGGLYDVERALAELEALRYVSRVPRVGRTYPRFALAARGRLAVGARTRMERTA